MISKEQGIQDLRQEIALAFATTARPGQDDLVSHACRECDQIVSMFRDRRWTEIPASQVREHSLALPLLTPAAHRYFLPAYLLCGLEDVAEGERRGGMPPGDVCEFLVSDLACSWDAASAELAEWWLARVAVFSTRETLAIVRFLGLVEDCFADATCGLRRWHDELIRRAQPLTPEEEEGIRTALRSFEMGQSVSSEQVRQMVDRIGKR